jgi:hypothetical protein
LGVSPRITVPGQLVNASAGRVHITRYTGAITLEVARASQADYVAHCERVGSDRNPVLMISERPFPLPAVEVRSYWREATMTPGFEAVAVIMTGVVGLMAAAVTHLGEQLVAVLGVHFRSFKTSDDASHWLTITCDCGIDEFDLMDIVDAVLAIDPNGQQ